MKYAGVIVAFVVLALHASQATSTTFLYSSGGNGTNTNCTTSSCGSCLATVTCYGQGECNTAAQDGSCVCTNSSRIGSFCNVTLATEGYQSMTFNPSATTNQQLQVAGQPNFVMTFPPGALSSAANIQVAFYASVASLMAALFSTPPTQTEITAAGNPMKFEPSGLVFSVPVSVQIPVSTTTTVPTGFTVQVFKLDESTGTWNKVGGVYDASTGTVTVELSSFSYYGPFVTPETPGNGNEAQDGDSNHRVVYGVVIGVLCGLFLVIAAMLSVAYSRRKDANNMEVVVTTTA